MQVDFLAKDNDSYWVSDKRIRRNQFARNFVCRIPAGILPASALFFYVCVGVASPLSLSLFLSLKLVFLLFKSSNKRAVQRE
jgi:hypothetical protein